MHTRNLTRRDERNLADIRCLTEALMLAAADSGLSRERLAEKLGVSRGYLNDALNEDRSEVLSFQARLLEEFCRACGILPLSYIAGRLGFMLVPVAQAQSAESVAAEALDVSAQVGTLALHVRAAVSDGRLTPQERQDIVSAARRVQREAAEVERAATVASPQIAKVTA